MVMELNSSDQVTDKYIRGSQLIKSDINGYYLYNAHGDVIQLTDPQGTITTSYLYDAFGIEQSQQINDPNPFRYCGEYLDKESGNVYLRARYYDPENGRFISPDTHWNQYNMIYGDEAIKLEKLSLLVYSQNNDNFLRDNSLKVTYMPDVNAIMQSRNLYVYCMDNPVKFIDITGNAVRGSGVSGSLVGLIGVEGAVFKVEDDYGNAAWVFIASVGGGFSIGIGSDSFEFPTMDKIFELEEGIDKLDASASILLVGGGGYYLNCGPHQSKDAYVEVIWNNKKGKGIGGGGSVNASLTVQFLEVSTVGELRPFGTLLMDGTVSKINSIKSGIVSKWNNLWD